MMEKPHQAPSSLADSSPAHSTSSSPVYAEAEDAPSKEKSSAAASTSSSSNKSSFPKKLYQLLEDAEENGFDDVVSWMPQGHAFIVRNPKEFTDNIMSDYFR